MTVERNRPVAAAVVVRDGRVLMVRRRVPEGRLRWQFPAGKIEAGESAAAAAVRETEEETGLVVVATALLGTRVHPDTGRRLSYVACTAPSGTPRPAAPAEVAAVAWLTPAQLATHVPHGLSAPAQAYVDAVLGG